MRMLYSCDEYDTEFFEDFVGGFGAFNLFRIRQERHCVGGEKRVLVGGITYWDAMGDFCVETFSTDVPLVVFEKLIAEAREMIKTR